MRKFLKIAVTALCLAACMALVGLWVRSYQVNYRLRRPIAQSTAFAISSVWGRLAIVYGKDRPGSPRGWSWEKWEYPEGFESWNAAQPHWFWGLTLPSTVYGHRLVIPHWFPALVFAMLAVAPWLKWRFTVRTLLVATGVVAAILGMAIATN